MSPYGSFCKAKNLKIQDSFDYYTYYIILAHILNHNLNYRAKNQN
jgi:hypothetical protein